MYQGLNIDAVSSTYRLPKTTLEKSVIKSSGTLIVKTETERTNSAFEAKVVSYISTCRRLLRRRPLPHFSKIFFECLIRDTNKQISAIKDQKCKHLKMCISILVGGKHSICCQDTNTGVGVGEKSNQSN